jgi:hypothetical protein
MGSRPACAFSDSVGEDLIAPSIALAAVLCILCSPLMKRLEPLLLSPGRVPSVIGEYQTSIANAKRGTAMLRYSRRSVWLEAPYDVLAGL